MWAVALFLVAAGLALLPACSPGGGGTTPGATDLPTRVPATVTPTPRPTATRTPIPTVVARKPLVAAPPAPPEVVSKAETVMARAAAVRSLPAKGQVPLGLLAPNQVRSYLTELFEREHARQELEKDRAAMVLLDLLKEDHDLYRLWLSLLSEQIAGFYEFDARQMKLVGTGDRLSALDEMLLAHEYVHALQDQNFELGAKLKKARGVGESAAALQALSEGDATLAMGLYGRQHLTAGQLAAASNQSSGLSQEKLRAAPAILQLSLLFPYLQGTAFVTALNQSGGWAAVDRAYGSPPTTSEQILHPEKYVAGEGPAAVQVPDVAAALGPQWLLLKEDVLGELGALAYLLPGVPAERASKAAAGWGGDRMLLFRSLGGHNYALVVASTWDTPEDAAEFYSAVRELRRSKKGETVTAGDRSMTWSVPFRSGYAALVGSRVMLVVGPDEATMRKIVNKLEADPARRP